MRQTDPFESHAPEYDAWFEEHAAVYESEILAIRQHLEALPENVQGIEVGLGTGRYAAMLGIKEGVEPASPMRETAIKRGIEVMDATAEHLPYKDLRFDFVLFVTICHFNNVKKAFKEAHRVISKGGVLVVAFIDKSGIIGRGYEEKKPISTFYKHARFYTVDEIKTLLKDSGFKQPVFTQTLFGTLEEIREVQAPKDGYGEGSFVVVRAYK